MQAVSLFKSYFGGAFDEDAIRNNFVLIYELLDGINSQHLSSSYFINSEAVVQKYLHLKIHSEII